MVKDDTAISLDALDAKYGLPLFESKDKHGIYMHISPNNFKFKTTAELKAPKGLERILGQEQQLSAIMEGLAIQRPDYNLIIQCGSEQDVPLLIKVITEEYAARTTVQNVDQISWQNFSEQLRPKTGSVPAGYGRVLRDYMDKGLAELAKYEPKADEISGFKEHMTGMTKKIIEKTELAEKIEKEALDRFKKEGIEVERTEDGAINIKNMKDLTLEQKKKAAQIGGETQKKLSEQLQETMGGINEFMEQNKAPIIRNHIIATGNDILAQYDEMVKKGEFPADMSGTVREYITDVFTHLAEHPEKLKEGKAGGLSLLAMMAGGAEVSKGKDDLLPHIIIDNTGKEGLISIVETDPDPSALLGNIEYSAKAPHTRLNPGLLARANKGILAISYADWGLHPRGLVKYKLLQALETGKADIGGLYSFDKVDAKADANVKLMLFVSDVGRYFSRFEENDRFTAYFKKRITLERRVPMTVGNLAKLARAVKGEVIDSNLPDFDKFAVARLAEYLMLPFGKDKMSTDVSFYRDILIRAGISAKNAGREIATKEDIDIAYNNYRGEKNNVEKLFREYIKKGFFIISDKPEVGVVNGLSYLATEIPFGHSLRIGVTVRPNPSGSGRFVNIDEKADLSGEMFTKSFLQVASMIRDLYQKQDVQMHFDLETSVSQSDHGINGPSAGAAMSLACISALAEVPVEPHVFFTGGIDPKSGKVTIIGGVNEKVMGVYHTCKDLGIKDGIAVIPKTNVGDLQLLEPEVHEAIRKGEFRVYAHEHINETIEIGTKMKAEKVHEKVMERLRELNKHYDKKKGKKG